ncbi:hypothetical protein ACSSS7_002447 [Eimeria intestinalis]
MVNSQTNVFGFFLILLILFVFESSLCVFFASNRGILTDSESSLKEACSISGKRFALSVREAPYQCRSLRNRHQSTLSFCPSFHKSTTIRVVTAADRTAGTDAKRLSLAVVYSAVHDVKRGAACGAGDSAAPVTSASGAGDAHAHWDAIPITRLRTAARKLQLSTKGTRAEIRKRLEESVSTKKALAVLRSIEDPENPSETHEGQNKVSEYIPDAAQKSKAMRCHVCNSRLSAKARFCSKEQEVGSNTMRVESGFWQSILQVIGDVPVVNLSAAVWEEYLRVLKKRNCSPRTQALHQVAYLAALKYAVHTRRLDGIHPFRKIRGCTKRTLASVPFTAEEVYLLLAATPNTMHCALFAVGIGAGLRPSELLSMRWEDVNMEEMTATIRGSKTAASAAAIPLTDLAGRELMRW